MWSFLSPGRGYDPEFLEKVENGLFEPALGALEQFPVLYFEEDPHIWGDTVELYTLSARKPPYLSSCLPMPILALEVMEFLLKDLCVFTSVYAPPKQVTPGRKPCFYVSPHEFARSYARFHHAHEEFDEPFFFNGSDSFITVTNGMNRPLMQALHMTPLLGSDVLVVQTAHAPSLFCVLPADFDSAYRRSGVSTYLWNSLSDPYNRAVAHGAHLFWTQYAENCVRIGMPYSEEAKSALIGKLQTFCTSREMQLEIV